MRRKPGPLARFRIPRGTRPPKVETPKIAYKRRPKHRRREDPTPGGEISGALGEP